MPFEEPINTDWGGGAAAGSEEAGGGDMDIYMRKNYQMEVGTQLLTSNSQWGEAYDIFKSKYNSATKTFEAAVNIGYPINTPEDNMQFSLAGNRRDAYISAYRKEGYGDLDIYKITFNEVENLTTVLKGKVYTADSLAAAKDVELKVLDVENQEVFCSQKRKQNCFYFSYQFYSCDDRLFNTMFFFRGVVGFFIVFFVLNL